MIGLRFSTDRLTFVLFAAAVTLSAAGCASVPENKVSWYRWPKAVYTGVPEREFEKLGQVRTRVEYNSLDFEHEESRLCKNYFNRAAQDLLKRARQVGADAVIDMRSVVFQLDGKIETYDTPECTDDGVEGQVLAQGVAIKWKKPLGKGESQKMKTYSQKAREVQARGSSPVLAPGRQPAASPEAAPQQEPAFEPEMQARPAL